MLLWAKINTQTHSSEIFPGLALYLQRNLFSIIRQKNKREKEREKRAMKCTKWESMWWSFFNIFIFDAISTIRTNYWIALKPYSKITALKICNAKIDFDTDNVKKHSFRICVYNCKNCTYTKITLINQLHLFSFAHSNIWIAGSAAHFPNMFEVYKYPIYKYHFGNSKWHTCAKNESVVAVFAILQYLWLEKSHSWLHIGSYHGIWYRTHISVPSFKITLAFVGIAENINFPNVPGIIR